MKRGFLILVAVTWMGPWICCLTRDAFRALPWTAGDLATSMTARPGGWVALGRCSLIVVAVVLVNIARPRWLPARVPTITAARRNG